ncbi:MULTISPECIES: hypothetical protein [Gracilimonas]|uniref:Uncharacterized protein n=1 Tax=Gracilimonas sediminicola TaxID=2952158 RepID=A0A9X2L679_9BACT|nr:hypothetical protein [Gracilimonas sediminicola]MCP9292323.1 hypothetical protein [Gracilimonas sediminicola]
MFTIRFGVPEMEDFWNDLKLRKKSRGLSKDEEILFKQLAKAIQFLAANPRHPGLNSHEIEPLSKKFGQKVFQSYLENNTPAAGRIFWVYGPNRKEITILGIEPHPEDKKRGAYERIKLSDLPE